MQVELLDVPLSAMTFNPTEVDQQDLITRLTNRLQDLEKIKADALAEIDARDDDITKATAQLDAPFRYTDALTQAEARFADLDAQLAHQAAPPPAIHPGDAAGPAEVREILLDTGFDLSAWFASWAAWPVAPSQADQDFLERTAADLACRRDVQAAALAGDARTFIDTFDRHLRELVDGCLAAGVLRRDGFWAACLADAHLRSQLAAGLRGTAYTALRACAPRFGRTPQPTTADESNQLPPDAAARSGLPVNARALATAIQQWLTEHTAELTRAPGEDEQSRLTTLATAVARTPLVQDHALANDAATFIPLYVQRLRHQVADVIDRQPHLRTTAPLLAAVAAGAHAGLLAAAADAAHQQIRHLAHRLDTTAADATRAVTSAGSNVSPARVGFAAGPLGPTPAVPQPPAPPPAALAPSSAGPHR